MKKKRIYEKPVMQVFELKKQQQLLVGSGFTGTRNADDYGTPIDPWSE